MSVKRPAIFYRGKLHLIQNNACCQIAKISARMTSEIVVDQSADWHGLLLVTLEHAAQTQECKNGTVDKTNIGGRDG